MTSVSELLSRAQNDLAAAEAALVSRLSTDPTRARADVVRQLHEVRRMRSPLYRYASQAGQDVVVDRLLSGKTGGIFVDVGGYDGVTGSNSLYFEQFRGWSGLIVEAVPGNHVQQSCATALASTAQSATATARPSLSSLKLVIRKCPVLRRLTIP